MRLFSISKKKRNALSVHDIILKTTYKILSPIKTDQIFCFNKLDVVDVDRLDSVHIVDFDQHM
jgi:hypothetical protein